jgi:hypothetical protein
LYNHIRPHSAHGGLTPEAVRLNYAAGRLGNLEGSADRPLPPASQISYQTPGLSQSPRDRRGAGQAGAMGSGDYERADISLAAE